MALRDYFHERWGSDSRSNDASHASSPDSRHPDKWALDYLNVTRMQPISEAFDDDASGFVTVTEVNTFTTSRPLGWRYVFLLVLKILLMCNFQLTALDSLLGDR